MKVSIGKYGVLIIVCLVVIALFPIGENRPPRSEQKLESNISSGAEVYSFTLMKQELSDLATNPDIKLATIGRSVLDREIHRLTVGSGERNVLVIGAIHGREWITAKLLVEMAKNLVSSQPQEKELSDFSFVFVPMVNPDGVEIAQQGVSAGGDRELLLAANQQRQDFSGWKANARGVNLNIQFDANWDKAVSQDEPHFEKYKGPRPESEPESKALADLVREIQPQALLAYHASGEVIYWQYGQTGAEYERDRAIANTLAKTTGYELAKEARQDSHGGLKDWFITEFNKPGFTVEVGPPVGDKPLPANMLSTIFEQNKEVLKSLARELSD